MFLSSSKKYFSLFLFAMVFFSFSCTKKPSPAKKETSTTLPAISNNSSIVITENSTSGTSLVATVGRQVTWNFQASGGSGGPATISNIYVTNTKMIVNGSSVSFSPSSAADINGQITVSASAGTLTGSQTFILSQAEGGPMGGGFLGIVSTLMSAIGLENNPVLSTILGFLQNLKNKL